MADGLATISEETRQWLADDVGAMEIRRWGVRATLAIAQLLDNLERGEPDGRR